MLELLRVFALSLGAALPLLLPNVVHYCDPSIFNASAPKPFGTAPQGLACEPYVVETPTGALYLVVARTPADRERGLMNVTELEPRAGVLFAFADEAPREFWMKNTLIPLDMVFLNAEGEVTSIAARVPASKATTSDLDVARRSGRGKYVIELRAGTAKASGLVTGTRLTLPPVAAEP
jgi:uncharacterized membrane protein (UPF0127 family)